MEEFGEYEGNDFTPGIHRWHPIILGVYTWDEWGGGKILAVTAIQYCLPGVKPALEKASLAMYLQVKHIKSEKRDPYLWW